MEDDFPCLLGFRPIFRGVCCLFQGGFSRDRKTPGQRFWCCSRYCSNLREVIDATDGGHWSQTGGEGGTSPSCRLVWRWFSDFPLEGRKVFVFQLVNFLGMSWEKLRMETELNRTSENVSPLLTGLYFKLPSCTAKELMFKLQAKGKDWLPLQKQIGPRFGWEFGMMIHESLSIAKNYEGS